MNLIQHSTRDARPHGLAGSAIGGMVAEVDMRLPASSEAEQAFVTVYDALFPRLCKFAERFLSADDAEEAVQVAMTRIWKDWAVISVDRPEAPFFFRTVLNQIETLRRGVKAQRRGLGEYLYDWTHRSRRQQPDALLEQAELARVIDSAVAALPDRCREVWVLVRDNSLTYEGAAAAMGVTPATAKKHMTNAQKALREAITDAGYRDAARATGKQAQRIASPEAPAATPADDVLLLQMLIPIVSAAVDTPADASDKPNADVVAPDPVPEVPDVPNVSDTTSASDSAGGSID